MNHSRLRLTSPASAFASARPDAPVRRLGQLLVEAGLISPAQLVQALEAQLRLNVPLGEILVSKGLLQKHQLLDVLAQQAGLMRANLEGPHRQSDLMDHRPREFWFRHRAVPWMTLGDATIIATENVAAIPALRASFAGSETLFVVAPEDRIMAHLSAHYARAMVRDAESKLAAPLSCRHWCISPKPAAIGMLVALCLGTAALWLAPLALFTGLCMIAVFTLALISGLKLVGLLAWPFRIKEIPTTTERFRPIRLPRISILVPLFHETEIADTLVERLKQLTYPEPLLDVLLVLEDSDAQTRETLRQTALPPWMRIIEVPDSGTITTKPRALNYALRYCKGEIIGVWDAEDAPAPDQLDRVAQAFSEAPAKTACLQGILDYYNPRSNWLSRCFTIEYASWFRVILPGISRLGLVIPLGGTTFFVRRAALERVGAWDAHNVTEDADLGVRLARFGYKTELIPTVTGEEANCHPLRWIRQRSRWLKGFMMTYAVHMRAPRRLLRDLGWKRFIGVQCFFLGTLAQFLLSPVLLSFWMIPFGLPHPVALTLSPALLWAICGLFFFTEVINLIIGCLAVSGPRHRFLMIWVPTLPLYFPMGALAAYKAAAELIRRPFYWDKTEHGLSLPDGDAGAA